MSVKPYIARADEAGVKDAESFDIYGEGKDCGLRFKSVTGALIHDTGPRFRGRDAFEMARRAAHFLMKGERLSGGRQGL